eukprot:PhF_6_TR42130/c0_g1_i1/m.63634
MTSYSRLQAQITNYQKHNGPLPRNACFLVLSGSFNPIHVDHITALESAKTALEAQHIPVLAGFVCPSSHSYVKGKLQDEAMSEEDRVHTCALAIQGSTWLEVCDLCCASGSATGQHIHNEILQELGVALQPILVYGADFFVKYGNVTKSWGSPVVCVGRGRDTAQIERQLRHACQKDNIPYNGSYGNFHLATSLGGEVSSTKIREFLRTKDYARLLQSKWVHPDIVTFLQFGWHQNLIANRCTHAIVVKDTFNPITIAHIRHWETLIDQIAKAGKTPPPRIGVVLQVEVERNTGGLRAVAPAVEGMPLLPLSMRLAMVQASVVGLPYPVDVVRGGKLTFGSLPEGVVSVKCPRLHCDESMDSAALVQAVLKGNPETLKCYGDVLPEGVIQTALAGKHGQE